MGALTITIDERDRGRLHLRGDVIASDLSAVLDTAVSLLPACGPEVVVEVASSADDARLVVLVNDLARHAARWGKRVIVEISEDAPPSLTNASFDEVIRIERTRRMPVTATRAPGPPSAKIEAAGIARREGRGFVVSFGEGRRCAARGCRTTLSRYNADQMCWVHEASLGNRRA